MKRTAARCTIFIGSAAPARARARAATWLASPLLLSLWHCGGGDSQSSLAGPDPDAGSSLDGSSSTSDAGIDAAGGATGADAADAGDAFSDTEPHLEAGSDAAPPIVCLARPRWTASSRCGDGYRDPDNLEECDDGNTANNDLCSSECRVSNALVASPTPPPLKAPARKLGRGAHVVSAECEGFAVVYTHGDEPQQVALAAFDDRGARVGVLPNVSQGSIGSLFTDPVVAALPGGRYAVAWSDFGGDGSQLGVGLRLVDVQAPAANTVGYANASFEFSQHSPDVIRTPSELIVAWVDEADIKTGPDVRFRRFSHSLTALSPWDETLAGSGKAEGAVALSAFASGWAAAWRETEAGRDTLGIKAGDVQWQVGPYAPGPVTDRPALVALDSTRLLAVFTAATAIANTYALRGAILDVARPGATASFAIPALSAGNAALSQSEPSLSRVGEGVFLAWHTRGALGSAQGEELWLKSIAATTSAGTLTLDLSRPETPLARSAEHRLGDQRLPTVAAVTRVDQMALATVWEDWGYVFGVGEGRPDVTVGFLSLPLLRVPEIGSTMK